MQAVNSIQINLSGMKKTFIIISISVLFFSACGHNQKTNPQDKQSTRSHNDSILSIAVMPTWDCLPLFVAQERGFYEPNSSLLELKIYDSQMQCDQALIHHQCDGGMTDLVRALRLKASRVPLMFVMQTESSWQLLANRLSRVKKANQLQDKIIAVTRFSATHYFAQSLIDSIKSTKDIFQVQVNDVNLRLKMLTANELESAFLPEPQATLARMQGAVVLADTRHQYFKSGVFVQRGDLNLRKKQLLKTLLQGYAVACDSLNKFGAMHYTDVIKKYYNLDSKTIQLIPKTQFKAKQAVAQQDIVQAQKPLR